MKDLKAILAQLQGKFPQVDFKLDDGTIFLVHRGVTICDPYWSECERFQVAADYYGIDEDARELMYHANDL